MAKLELFSLSLRINICQSYSSVNRLFIGYSDGYSDGLSDGMSLGVFLPGMSAVDFVSAYVINRCGEVARFSA